jgi:hypothetical protein
VTPADNAGRTVFIVLNSDVLWTGRFSAALPNSLQRFVDACRDQDHRIIIPLTTLLEFDRRQSDQVSKERNTLTLAYATLDRLGITYESQDPDAVITAPDLLSLITGSGAAAEVIEPTLEDLKEAHRRACLHLAPQPPDTKNDEMRDLVIWMTAVRIADENDGALLISNDVVHTHNRGNDEAATVKLTRVHSIEEALEYLEVETPAGQLFRAILVPAWSALAEAGIPVPGNPTVLSVSNPIFIQGSQGLASASCTLKVRSSDNQIIQAYADVQVSANKQQVTLTNIKIGDQAWAKPVTIETDVPQQLLADSEESMAELRRLLEEGK